MGKAVYEIVRNGAGWGIAHDGMTAGEYLTKEAAFESAVPAASLAIKQGHEVTLRVTGQTQGQSPDGLPTGSGIPQA
ncbi:hypothetical protein PY365_33895 [Roseiarcaceae bacterium H3SJ34-1]|uniref:hypothetical protein n=1 Tax=Terripilifer ovatus TaxID=3032367 RepID=UPI003AB979F9|nr:hypothetical protein [Roseiarcaceae bacterium H3SJ34-1]